VIIARSLRVLKCEKLRLVNVYLYIYKDGEHFDDDDNEERRMCTLAQVVNAVSGITL